MNPWRSPQKILARHVNDELAKLSRDSRPPTPPTTARAITPQPRPATAAPAQDRRGLNDHQAVTPTRPPARQQEPKPPVPQAETWTTRTAALEHSDLMTQRDHFHERRDQLGIRCQRRRPLLGTPSPSAQATPTSFQPPTIPRGLRRHSARGAGVSQSPDEALRPNCC
jgi:hypothetical protein